MDRPSNFVAVQKPNRRPGLVAGFAALIFLFLPILPGWAMQIPVRDGQTVKLKLRNVLTTDNVQKGGTFDFDVAEDVLVNGHVVIAKGATAHGKVVDIRGAFNPRAKDAEVTFQFLSVSAVDQQDLPLRTRPEKIKKGKEELIHERSVIPGQITHIVGAEKGKEYEAYIDESHNVNASDTIAVTPTAAPAAPEASQPSAPAASAPPPPLAVPDVALASSSVKFDSTPDGANIVIDGNVVGSTPATLRLNPGHHTIEIRMAGFRTWSRVMVVDPDSHPSVRATLVKQ